MSIPIYVAPGKMLRGLVTFNGFDQDPVGLCKKGEPVKLSVKLTDLEELFAQDSIRDSHVVTYTIKDPEGNCLDRIPRLNKGSLDAIRAAGYTIEHITVWIDADLKDIVGRTGHEEPPKLKWHELTPEEQTDVWTRIENARIKLGAKGMEWVASYSTESGLRFIHALAIPVPAGASYEALVARFISAYALAGLPADDACKDWTRLFRAPRVTKESGLQTWEQEWFTSVIDLTDDRLFYIPTEKDLRPPDVAPTVSIDRTAGRPTPDPTAAMALIEYLDGSSGKARPTPAAKAAKSALEDSGTFAWVFGEAPLAFPGNRHTMLTRAVGEIVGTLHGLPNITPEFVFGLLYIPVSRFQDDETWHSKAWEMITTFWDREETKKAQKAVAAAEVVEEQAAVQETERERFLRGVRSWCVETNGMDDEAALEYVKTSGLGLLREARRDTFRILMPSGYYDEHGCSINAIPRMVEQLGMEWLTPIEYMKMDRNGNATVSRIPPATLAEAATVYSTEEIRLDRRGSYLKKDMEGRATFVSVPFYLRDDIEPLLTPAIYELWMAAAGGNEELGRTMIAAMASLLLFQHGPTAAVCLWGKGNSGKSLAALSLGECISTRRLADGASLTDNFNDTMRLSPIVHVDEALDRGSKGIDASAALRRLITSTNTSIEQKGKDKVWMQGVHRVLMTANSADILTSLLGSRVRGDADMKAIGERIAAFQMHEKASEWLTKHNQGWRTTRGWIGEHGRVGLYAKFWFWAMRACIDWEQGKPKMRGRRLLFEGNAQSTILRELEEDTGPIPAICAAINRMVGVGSKPKVVIARGRLWIQRSAVAAAVCSATTEWKSPMILQALRAMELDEQQEDRPCINGQQARWKAMDLRKIRRMIEAHMIPHPLFNDTKSLELAPLEDL